MAGAPGLPAAPRAPHRVPPTPDAPQAVEPAQPRPLAAEHGLALPGDDRVHQGSLVPEVVVHLRAAHPGRLLDILQAARVSGSQMYHYFGDKASLVHAVIAWQGQTVLGRQWP